MLAIAVQSDDDSLVKFIWTRNSENSMGESEALCVCEETLYGNGLRRHETWTAIAGNHSHDVKIFDSRKETVVRSDASEHSIFGNNSLGWSSYFVSFEKIAKSGSELLKYW